MKIVYLNTHSSKLSPDAGNGLHNILILSYQDSGNVSLMSLNVWLPKLAHTFVARKEFSNSGTDLAVLSTRTDSDRALLSALTFVPNKSVSGQLTPPLRISHQSWRFSRKTALLATPGTAV